MKALLLLANLFFLGLHLAVGQDIQLDSLNLEKLESKASDLERDVNEELNGNLQKVNYFIDSLNNTDISAPNYKSKLDSVYNFININSIPLLNKSDSLNAELQNKMEKVQQQLLERRTRLDSLINSYEGNLPLPPDLKKRLSAKLDLEGLNIPNLPKVPTVLKSLKLADVSLPGVNIPDISTKLSIPEVPVPSEASLPELQTNGLQSPAIDQIINNEVGKLDEIKALTEASSSVSTLTKETQDFTETFKNPTAINEGIRTKAKKKFVDYFAGHEEIVQSEIESLEKLQRKYQNVADARYLPKRRTNPEKEKPFIERLIIGTGFQIDRQDVKWTGVDVSPYAGYKFSDRFRACIGGTYRVTVDVKTLEFSQKNKVFGFRTFGDYRIFNGWYGHLEVEALKTKIPAYHTKYSNQQNPNEMTWVPMAYIGILKSYSLGRNLQGQTQILYDFLDVAKNFNFNKVSFRFGFEYKFMKKKKQG